MSWFSEGDRVKLRHVADVLIPEAEGMPAASTVGAADALLDRIINLRSDLAPLVLRALRALPAENPRTALDRLRSDDDEAFGALSLAIAAAYYISPDVCALTGYHGPQRIAPDTAALLADAELLAPVLDRGAIWRVAPSQ